MLSPAANRHLGDMGILGHSWHHSLLPTHHSALIGELEAHLPHAPTLAQGPRLQKLEHRLKAKTGADVVGTDDFSATFERHKLLLTSAMPLFVEKSNLVADKFEHDQRRISTSSRRDSGTETVGRDTIGSTAHGKGDSEGGAPKHTLARKWWVTAAIAARTIASDHTLISLFYVYDPRNPRAVRCFIACIDVIMILFAEAIAYWYTDPVGICLDQKTEENCENVISPTGFFTSRRQCEWDPLNEDPCYVRDASAAQEHSENIWEAFICVVIALPIIALFDYLFRTYLAAPLKRSNVDNQDGGAPPAADAPDVASSHPESVAEPSAEQGSNPSDEPSREVSGEEPTSELPAEPRAQPATEFAAEPPSELPAEVTTEAGALERIGPPAELPREPPRGPSSSSRGPSSSSMLTMASVVKKLQAAAASDPGRAESPAAQPSDDLVVEPPTKPPNELPDHELPAIPSADVTVVASPARRSSATQIEQVPTMTTLELHADKCRIERELGLLLLHNLGVINDSDPENMEDCVELLGLDGLPIESTVVDSKLPAQVAGREEMVEWFCLRATGAVMRAVLLRRQEYLDALDDLLDGGSIAQDANMMPETIDFTRRKKVLHLLIDALEAQWSCPPINSQMSVSRRAAQAVARKKAARESKNSSFRRAHTNRAHMHKSAKRVEVASDTEGIDLEDATPSRSSTSTGTMEPRQRRKLYRQTLAFARRTYANLKDNLEQAVEFQERHADGGLAVGDSSLSKARALYQLMFLEFFNHKVERRVYHRLLEIDDARELRHPAPPVSRKTKILAGFGVFLLVVAPVYAMIIFGRQLGSKGMREWFRTAMLAGFMILFVIEPLRIAFVNVFLPQLLVPKMGHFHDPCQIVSPFRTPLPVAPADLVPSADLAEAFADDQLNMPKRLALAPAARIAASATPVTVERKFDEPVVRHSTVKKRPYHRGLTDKVLAAIATSGVDHLHAHILEPDHPEKNRRFRVEHPHLWSDASVFKLEADLDFHPPRNYSLAIALFAILTAFNQEVEEIVFEETINLLIGFSSGLAAVFFPYTSVVLVVALTAILSVAIVCLIYATIIFIVTLFHFCFHRRVARKAKARALREQAQTTRYSHLLRGSGTAAFDKDPLALETLYTPTDYLASASARKKATA